MTSSLETRIAKAFQEIWPPAMDTIFGPQEHRCSCEAYREIMPSIHGESWQEAAQGPQWEDIGGVTRI